MFVKTKERAGRTSFYLCIAADGGSGWKSIEYSVCLGDTLELSASEWLKKLRGSTTFRSVSLDEVLKAMERYAAEHRLRAEILEGLREAARTSHRKKTRRNAFSDRRSQETERETALRLLGLPLGSSDDQIESAFRKAARRLHPDVGGDAEKFRAVLEARNLLLGRASRLREPA